MKAIVYHKYGTPDVLELKERDKPFLGDNEVLIKVHAASINDWDWGLLHGDFINRILNGLWKPKRKIPGFLHRQPANMGGSPLPSFFFAATT
jgi:NADPH:quinone reductase-like Zn-dependent oxidoreductase